MGLCLGIFTQGSSLGFAADTPCEPGQAASLRLSPGSLLALASPASHNSCKPQSQPINHIILIQPTPKQGVMPYLGPYPRATGSPRVIAAHFDRFPYKNKPTTRRVRDLMPRDRTVIADLNLPFSSRPHMLHINICRCVKSNFVWYLLRGEVGSHLDVAAKRQAHQWHRINNGGHK